MPDPAWPSSPPEVNYLRLAGSTAAGTATTLASAAAWQALMVSIELACSLSAVNAAATALDFEGLGGAGSMTALTGLNGALQLLAGWAQEKPPIAASAVAAYEAAVSSMIPAEVSLANRAEQASDVALNPLVFGALTPAIVALDAVYFGEHWPQNSGAGAAYGSALAALVPALAIPPPLSPPGAAPAAPASAAAAVAEAAGQAAGNTVAAESGQFAKVAGDTPLPAEAAGQLGQLASGMMQPLMGMFQAPTQALQSVSSLPQSMMGQFGGLSGGAEPDDAAIPMGMPAPAGALGIGSAAGMASGLGGTGGAGAAGVGHAGSVGVPSAGLTSFTRPTSGFAPEGGGRPVSLKSGLLGGPESRGPTPFAGGGVPTPMTQAGSLSRSKGETAKEGGPRARVVIDSDRMPNP